jgi:hypothetical protein
MKSQVIKRDEEDKESIIGLIRACGFDCPKPTNKRLDNFIQGAI